MKYAAEMCSCAMIYRLSFQKIGSSIQTLVGGIHRHRQQGNLISLLQFFQNKESRKKFTEVFSSLSYAFPRMLYYSHVSITIWTHTQLWIHSRYLVRILAGPYVTFTGGFVVSLRASRKMSWYYLDYVTTAPFQTLSWLGVSCFSSVSPGKYYLDYATTTPFQMLFNHHSWIIGLYFRKLCFSVLQYCALRRTVLLYFTACYTETFRSVIHYINTRR
jgi:hypothetical protein